MNRLIWSYGSALEYNSHIFWLNFSEGVFEAKITWRNYPERHMMYAQFIYFIQNYLSYINIYPIQIYIISFLLSISWWLLISSKIFDFLLLNQIIDHPETLSYLLSVVLLIPYTLAIGDARIEVPCVRRVSFCIYFPPKTVEVTLWDLALFERCYVINKGICIIWVFYLTVCDYLGQSVEQKAYFVKFYLVLCWINTFFALLMPFSNEIVAVFVNVD